MPGGPQSNYWGDVRTLGTHVLSLTLLGSSQTTTMTLNLFANVEGWGM